MNSNNVDGEWHNKRRKELFYKIWQWFEDNRFYSNWRTLDDEDQWTAKDFHLVTPENSAGSLAMEVGELVAGILRQHKAELAQAYKKGYEDGKTSS